MTYNVLSGTLNTTITNTISSTAHRCKEGGLHIVMWHVATADNVCDTSHRGQATFYGLGLESYIDNL